MRIMRNIIFSPFYKVKISGFCFLNKNCCKHLSDEEAAFDMQVLMADFFMGDQLTSQVTILISLTYKRAPCEP
jgi:hypothetical protein